MKQKLSQHRRVLSFKRAGVPFGVDVEHVREIRKFDTLRPLALAIRPMVGFVSLGQQIIPVFDPHAFGSTTRRASTLPITTIICQTEDSAPFALLADEVHNQTEVREDQFVSCASAGVGWLEGEIELAPGKKLILLAGDAIGSAVVHSNAAPKSELQHA